MNTGFQLFQLQSIDTEIDRAQRRISEITTELGSNEAVTAAQNKLKMSQAESERIRSDFDLLNQEIQQKKVKKSQSEASLYGGKISNPKELQDLQSEIASLTRVLSEMDEKLVEKLMQVDEADEKIQKCNDRLSEAQSAFETRKSMLTAENANLENAIRNLEAQRASQISQIDDASLRTYETLRKSKNGLAIARLQDECCSACGSALTAGQCQQARSASQLFFCPSCGRIVYGS